MKAISLVSCIMLSIFGIFLLSMGAQATEYREIKAKDILEHIKNNEEVNLTGYCIDGELNISTIKLETVPNPYFYKLVNEGFDKERLIHFGLNENLHVINSNVTIKNSIFEKVSNFSDVQFKNTANFSGTNFNSYVDFSGVNFNSSADFSWANFNSSADFSGTNFNSSANFLETNFNSSASLQEANLNRSEYSIAMDYEHKNIYIYRMNLDSSANFWLANFNGFADFSGANFNSSAEFSETNFNSSAIFDGTNFNSSAVFQGVNFKDSAHFSQRYYGRNSDFNYLKGVVHVVNGDSADTDKTLFNGYADFSLTNFTDIADFADTNFNGFAKFENTNFNNYTDFSWTNFNSPAAFAGTSFNNLVIFDRTNFYSSADFAGTSFNGFTNFSSTIFNNFIIFDRTNFNDFVDFSGTNFKDSVYFSGTNFKDFESFYAPDKSENVITDGKNCELFMKYYKTEARYTDADTIYYNYRNHAREQKRLNDYSKLTDFLSWVTCGYGTNLYFTLICVVVLVTFFAIVYKNPEISLTNSQNEIAFPKIYWRKTGIYRSSEENNENKSNVSFLECLCFSINTFTRLGSVNWRQRDNFWFAVTIEGIFGWIMLGIFLATLMHLLIRS